MRKLPHTAAEDLLEVIMRRYERASIHTDVCEHISPMIEQSTGGSATWSPKRSIVRPPI
jgi:hypothetical protein